MKRNLKKFAVNLVCIPAVVVMMGSGCSTLDLRVNNPQDIGENHFPATHWALSLGSGDAGLMNEVPLTIIELDENQCYEGNVILGAIVTVNVAIRAASHGVDLATAFLSDLICMSRDQKKYRQYRDPAYQAAQLAYYKQHYTPLSAFLDQDDRESAYAVAVSDNESAARKLAKRVGIIEAQIDDSESELALEPEYLAILIDASAKSTLQEETAEGQE